MQQYESFSLAHPDKFHYLCILIIKTLTIMNTPFSVEPDNLLEWPVRPYGKRQLAEAYAPGISPVSALNRLSQWIRHNAKLQASLEELGYFPRQQIFTSAQVQLIFYYLGRP